ncbi:MAG: tRNA (guanosine(46)-N7)-methyltransferase TrmB [Bacteroidia bacterium]|nr:tRNA (guanosine(46)-N7)-methyltransferase TrmB [Bacteroidia bacterium]
MSRRKMMKKTQFHELDRTFNRESLWPGEWKDKLGHQGKLILELGCGKAEFSLGSAANHPENYYIGIDIKADRLWVAAGQAAEMGLKNVAFLCINLLEIDQYFGKGEADEIWITFPDPFPKKKQAKHRMLNPLFLDKYKEVLHAAGALHYKTDNLQLFQYSLEVFASRPDLAFDTLSFDLHGNESLPAETKVLTTYEKKFMAMDTKINYVKMHFIG